MSEENLRVLLGNLSSSAQRTRHSSISGEFIERTIVETEEIEEEETLISESQIAEQEGWVTPLNSVVEEFDLTEYGQVYKYQRVKDPDSNDSKKFLVFCKDGVEEDWITLPGLLSNRYHIASLEKFIERLQGQIEIEPNRIIKEPFKLEWRGKTSYAINAFEDETAKLVFGIVSGLEIESIERIQNMEANLVVLTSNSYDGSRSLRLDYSLRNKGIIDGKEFYTTDYFTLCNYSNSVIHTSSLSTIASDLESIVSNIEPNIVRLKAVTEGLDNLAGIISKFYGKEERGQFDSIYENLAGEYKNLYILFMIASIILEKNYGIMKHQRIRGAFDTFISRIFR
jgi:hypothetical protein